MTTTFRLERPPTTLPDWYPPRDPRRPFEYTVRAVELDLLLGVMMSLRIVDATSGADDPGLVPPERFVQPGGLIDHEICTRISRATRRFVTEPMHDAFVASLATRWNEVQAALRRETGARGEAVVAGFESFPYDRDSLRQAILHWGAFNALGADHDGYRVVA